MSLPLRRPMGNAQSRLTGLGRAPQPNLTSNVNGAQTASRYIKPQYREALGLPEVDSSLSPLLSSAYDPSRQAPLGVSPANPQWMASRQEAGRMNPVQQPMSAEQWGQSFIDQTAPAPAPYAGGDVAGQAQYYRNTALQGYQPPGSSNQSARFIGSLQPGTDMNDPRFSGLNSYDGFSAAMDDPNRMTPDMKSNLATRVNQNAPAYDPTNQGGNRFAGSAARIQAAEAADQAAIAAGTQANQQRMQGIAADSPERAMDPNSAGRQFAYQDQQGRMVSTNRLGQLQQLQRQFPDDPEVAMSIAEEKQRGSALAQKQEEQRERRKAASSDGLTSNERRTLGYRNQVANNAMRKGILPMGADPNRPGFSHQERIARNNQEAADKSSFRSSETKLRRSAINAANTQERYAAASRDNQRLPSGQLRQVARDAAQNDLKNLMDPNFSGTARDGFHGQVVRDVGLTGAETPMGAASMIFSSGISTPEQAIAFQKYWKAMSRSDSKWLEGKIKDNDTSIVGERARVLNEMADVPPEEMYNWFEQNKDRLELLKAKGSSLTPPVPAQPESNSVDSGGFGFGY